MELFELLMKSENIHNILINNQTLSDYLGQDFDTLEELMSSESWDDVSDVRYPDYSGRNPMITIKDDVKMLFEDFDRLEIEVALIGVRGASLNITIHA